MAKWWIDSKRNKKYYVLYYEIKEPGIPLDEALELYSESNLFKGSQDKFSTADATSKPADEDADVTLINELVSRIIRQRNKVCLRPPTDKTSR
ncbi:20380_t:CDS:2 [Rhizophagus irregularis]|nr:20380_t:CDS:2 [Rhizophagus irregularis]